MLHYTKNKGLTEKSGVRKTSSFTEITQKAAKTKRYDYSFKAIIKLLKYTKTSKKKIRKKEWNWLTYKRQLKAQSLCRSKRIKFITQLCIGRTEIPIGCSDAAEIVYNKSPGNDGIPTKLKIGSVLHARIMVMLRQMVSSSLSCLRMNI